MDEAIATYCLYPKSAWSAASAKADFAKKHKQGLQAKVVVDEDCYHIFHIDAPDGITFLVPSKSAPSAE